MTNLYFRNHFVSLYYDKENLLGRAVWTGEVIGSEFREAVLLCSDLVDRHGLRGWLGDNRKMKAIHPSDLEWSLKHFIPKIIEGPLLRMATLPSEYEPQREAMQLMLDKGNSLDMKLIMRDFYDEAEATSWLMELATYPPELKHNFVTEKL